MTIDVNVIVIITINVIINVNVNVIVIGMVNVMVTSLSSLSLSLSLSLSGATWIGAVLRAFPFHLCVEFAVGSLVCSRYYGVPLSSKTNTSKFPFLMESIARTRLNKFLIKDPYALRGQTSYTFDYQH